MFSMQLLFSTCPPNSIVTYDLVIPIENITSDHIIEVKLPEGNTVELQKDSGQVKIARQDKQGLWQFWLNILDKNDKSIILDTKIIDALILDEVDKEIRSSVSEILGKLYQKHSGTSLTSIDVKDYAIDLYQKARGREIQEILRRVKEERIKGGNSESDRISRHNSGFCLLMLKECSSRLQIKPFIPSIAALTADFLCQELGTFDSDFAPRVVYDVLDNIPMLSQDKWVYYLRILSEGNPKYAVMCGAVDQLIKLTPSEYRKYVIQVAESRMERDISFFPYVGQIYKAFNYRQGMPKLLSYVEIDPSRTLITTLDLVHTFDYRESIAQLRNLAFITNTKELIDLLCSWKDMESISLILEKLEIAQNESVIYNIIESLKKIGDNSIIQKLKEISQRSTPEKAAQIDKKIEKWEQDLKA